MKRRSWAWPLSICSSLRPKARTFREQNGARDPPRKDSHRSLLLTWRPRMAPGGRGLSRMEAAEWARVTAVLAAGLPGFVSLVLFSRSPSLSSCQTRVRDRAPKSSNRIKERGQPRSLEPDMETLRPTTVSGSHLHNNSITFC